MSFKSNIADEGRIAFVQDVNMTEAQIMAIVQKPISQSILAEPSGPPA
jgi:hypothetical protein